MTHLTTIAFVFYIIPVFFCVLVADYMGAPDSIVRLLACEQNIADLFYTLSPPRIYANLNKKFRPNKD